MPPKSESDKKNDAGGHDVFKANLEAQLVANKEVDNAFEEGEAGKQKAGKREKGGKKEGAPERKKRKPREAEAEAAIQAEAPAAVPVEPEIVSVASAENSPVVLGAVESAINASVVNEESKKAAQKLAPEVAPESAAPPSAEEVADRLVKAMGFSDKVETEPTISPPKAEAEKNIELWTKPSLREQVTAEQKKAVEQFIQKEKDRPWLCLEEMLRILSTEQDPNVFTNEQELRSALAKAKLWLVGSKKIYQAIGHDTTEAQVRKIYKKMSDNGQRDFVSDYEPIKKAHQEVLEGMKNRLTGVRRGLMKKYPGGLVVRGGDVKVNDHKEKRANLDSNASLFLFNKILGFENAGEEEKKYLEKTNYIDYDKQPAKGGIHLDISPSLQGAWIKNDELYFDHHGGSSPRKSSAAEIIYQSFAKGRLLDHLKNEERVALDRLMQFTTALDSYTLPTGTRARVNWQTVWQSSDKTLFGAALFLQNDLPIEDLFNFFKEHDLEEAFVRPLDGLKDSGLARINQLRKDKKVEKSKEVIDNFFPVLVGSRAPKTKVVDSRLGKIVVMVQESRDDKLPPGLQAAALAQGLDGILTWEPRSQKWFLAVGPQQKITKELANSIGEGVWVRESMIKKEADKEKKGISLGELLEKLGVDLKNLEVYDGALAKAINRDKTMVTKIKPVPAPEVAVTSSVSAPATSEAPVKEPTAATVTVLAETTPKETAPTEATRPTAPKTSHASAPLLPTAPTEVAAPMPETVGEIIEVTAAKNALDAERQEYIETYQDFLRVRGKPSLFARLRQGARGLFKGGEEATMAELDENAREEITAARDKYLQAKVNYAQALYQQEARLLAQEGKTPAETAEALKQFGQQEIFEKLVIGEENVLQAACVAEWPPMEKGLLRRGFDAWVKLPLYQRLLIATGVLTGALYAGGAIGAGAIAATAGIRFGRSVSGALFGRLSSELVGKFLSGRIAKETGARTEEARSEMGIALVNEKFGALELLTEKYHQIFEDKVKKDKRKLLIQTATAIGLGAGASLGLGWLADATMGTGTGVQPEKASTPAAAISDGKGFEKIITDMKARGHLIDELTKQAREAAESARIEHVTELATLQKGEGIIHVLSRQLEDDPLRFGYSGSLANAPAVHEWARHLAGQISIEEGYWDPSQHAQKWFVYDSVKPMKFILTGDAEHGFHVGQSGAARAFVHFDEKIDSSAPAATETPAPAPRLEAASRQGLEPVLVSQLPIVSHQGMQQVFSIGEGTERVQPILAPADYEWAEAAQNHAHLLQEKLNAAQELATSYAGNTAFQPAADRAVENIQRDIQQFSSHVAHGQSLSGYSQLAPGQTWDSFHEGIKPELDRQIFKDAFRGVTNANLDTTIRLDMIKQMIPANQELAINGIKYHLAGNEVLARVGDWEGKVDNKNIDWFSKFHQSFGTTAGVSGSKVAALAKQLVKVQSA